MRAIWIASLFQTAEPDSFLVAMPLNGKNPEVAERKRGSA
jgi:hypothetical protein